MFCKICNHLSDYIFTAKILYKYNVHYYYCNNCGFMQTEEPYWLEEAYKEPINITDTGYIQRNIQLSQKLTIILNIFFDKNGKFLDYAGGYGMFTRLMRDIGFDFYWDDKYTKNLFARGFEHTSGITYEAITTFESFEHFVNPIKELENLLNLSNNIIFSTELLPYPIPKPEEWWYYGLNHGQHIAIYSEKTLQFLAKKYKLNYAHHNYLHIYSIKSITNQNLNILNQSNDQIFEQFKKQLKSKTWNDFLKLLEESKAMNLNK